MLAILETASRVGGLVAAHCEDRSIIEAAERTVPKPVESYSEFLRARPALAEEVSIRIATALAEATKARFHVLHVASDAAMRAVRAARAAGVDLSAETCPHYLFLSEEDYSVLGARMKVYPPIGAKDSQAALRAAIRSGDIASVGSDHAPHTPEEKDGTLDSTPAGIRGADTMVPLMIDAWLRGEFTLQEIVRVLASSTADRFGLGHRKGRIQVGLDADLTIVDPAAEWTLQPDHLHSLHRESVFEGRELRGRVTAVVRHGVLVARDGDLVAAVPGRFVPAERPGS